ncbi:MAG: cytochrome c [Salibacteraceae bacterium]
MKTNKIYAFAQIAIVVLTLSMTSCGGDSQSPGIEYMPDMYRSPALEPYAKVDLSMDGASFKDSMEALLPAEGSITRGYLPYGIPNTNDGYEMAGEFLKNPLASNEQILEEGKEIYTKFCVHCHGKEGAGDGLTVTAGGHPPPPAYNSAALKDLPEGKMFHTITYGKNLMGPHSSQLNVEERWKVIRYVQTLQNPEGEDGEKKEDADAESEEPEEVDETAMNNL